MNKTEYQPGGQDYGGRDEYSVNQAASKNAFATELTIHKLEDLLYASSMVTNDEYRCTVNAHEHVIQRQFSCLSGATKVWELTWPLIETMVDITYVFNKSLKRERYMVAASWMVRRPEIVGDPVTRAYYIDVYPEGPVQAFIEAYSHETDSLEDRRMTPYDFNALYTDLDMITDMHRAEISDNLKSASLTE